MVDEKQMDEQDQPGVEDEAPQTISLFLAIGLVIGALIVGLVIGYVAAPKGVTDTTTVPNGSQSAPPLSPGQAEKGQLPPGHPSIPGAGGSSSTATTGSAGTQPSTTP